MFFEKNFLCNFLLVFIFSLSTCDAQYIVFRISDKKILPLDNQEQYIKSIYPLLTSYTWPTSISYAVEIVKELSQAVDSISPIDEENFLRSRIKKVDSTLDIAFIPEITYELFAIDQLLSGSITLDKNQLPDLMKDASRPIGCFLPMASVYKIISTSPRLQDVFDFFKKINLTQTVAYAHWQMNAVIVQKFSDHPKISRTDITDVTLKLIDQMSHKRYANLLELPIYLTKLTKSISSSSSFNFLSRIIDLEYESKEKFAGILYRGTSAITNFVPSHNKKPAQREPVIDALWQLNSNESVTREIYKKYTEISSEGRKPYWLDYYMQLSPATASYGNSLFAGWGCDKGACAFYYFTENRIGYALLVDKRNYYRSLALEISGTGNKILDPLNLASIFRVVPLNSLLAVISGGGFFHSRNISYNKDYKKAQNPMTGHVALVAPNGVYGIPVHPLDKAFYDAMGYQIRVGNPLYYLYTLSSLLSNREVTKIVKLDGQTFEQQYDLQSPEQQKRVAQLFENQKRNTNFYNLLNKMEKKISTRKEKKIVERH